MILFGKAARFNGTSSVLKMNTTINSLMGNADAEATVSFWCRSKTATKILTFMYMEISTSGVTVDTTGTSQTYNFSNAFRLHDWNHIVIVKSAIWFKIYLNNILQHTISTGTLNALLNRKTTENLFGSDSVEFWAFDLDQYYEYSRALREEEVNLLYNQDWYITNIGSPGETNRMADMNIGMIHPAVASYETDLYTFGGQALSGAPMNELQMYDAYTNTISKITASDSPSGRWGASMNHNMGKMYIVGGRNSTTYFNELYEYDVVTKIFKKKANCPVTIAGHTTVVYKDHLYVIGGLKADGQYNTTVYEYSISSNKWKSKTTNNNYTTAYIRRESHAYKGKVFLFGNGPDTGDNVKDEVWVYNIKEDVLELYNPGRGRTNNRYTHTTQLINKLYVLYGFINSNSTITNRIMIFDIENSSWLTDVEMPPEVTKKYGAGLLTINNAMYIIGGKNEQDNVTKSVHVYFGSAV